MNRYLVNSWSGPRVPEPLAALGAMVRQLNSDIPEIMDWLVAMEINHFFTVIVHKPDEWGTRAYLMIPKDDDAFALKMAWNILPTPPKDGLDEEMYMAIDRRHSF